MLSNYIYLHYIYLSFPISLSCSLLLYPIYLRALVVQLLCVLYCLKNMCPLLGQSSTCGHKNMCPLLGQSCTGGHICVLYRLKDTYIYLSFPISLSCSLLLYPIYLRALVVQLLCVLYCLKNMCPLLGQSSTCGHKNMCPLLGQSCTGGHICVLYSPLGGITPVRVVCMCSCVLCGSCICVYDFRTPDI